MVYSISDKVTQVVGNEKINEKQAMDSRFQRAKTRTEEEEYPAGEGRRIWRNVLTISAAFMIHFTAFWGASNLQSSINRDHALGTFTLASIYGSLLLSNIFLPVVVIKWFGCKWTTSLSLITYMPFIMAQFYPRFYTMIPAGLAVGLGGGPLWCAKCTYLTVASEAYSKITGIASDVIVTRFFGVFFMFYQFSQVWGNLISSAVLSSGAPTTGNLTTELLIQNVTQLENVCGANFEPWRASEAAVPNLSPPPAYKINVISGIYLACMIAACLIVAFGVDSLSRYNKGRTGSGSGLSGLKLLAVTMKHLGNPYQLLILPITMFIGAEQAFITADYNASFVSCGWGISNVGYVMICFGVCNAISAVCTGSIVKVTGRSPVIAFALALHVGLMVTMLVWKPAQHARHMYFVVAGVWGIADAVWLVQINSLSGILFPGNEEAAYSNFRLWESTGSVITYSLSPYLSTRTKIYLLLGVLLVGVVGYTAVEIMERKAKRSKIDNRTKFELVNDTEQEIVKSGEVAE